MNVIRSISILILFSLISSHSLAQLDSMMSRASNRPIPSKRISEHDALQVSLLFIVSGSFILFFGAGELALGLGFLNLIWYNLVLYSSKKEIAFCYYSGFISRRYSSSSRMRCCRWLFVRSANYHSLIFLLYLANTAFLVITFSV